MANFDFSHVGGVNHANKELSQAERMARLKNTMMRYVHSNPDTSITEEDIDKTIEALTWLQNNKLD